MKTRTKEPTIRSRHIVALATASLVLAASAAPVTPTAWKQSNAYSAARDASKLGNAAGMDPTETYLYNQDVNGGVNPTETTSADNKEFLTTSNGDEAAGAAAGRVWVVADLGAVYDLSTIKIWNFNWDNTAGTPLTSLNGRGVSQFDILVRNTAADTDDGTVGGTAINLNNINYNVAIEGAAVFNLGTSSMWQLALENQSLTQAPNADDYAGQSFDLTGNTARFVAIRVDSAYAPAGIGLGKVRFDGIVVVPEPSAAILLGLGGLGLILRRRRS